MELKLHTFYQKLRVEEYASKLSGEKILVVNAAVGRNVPYIGNVPVA